MQDDTKLAEKRAKGAACSREYRARSKKKFAETPEKLAAKRAKKSAYAREYRSRPENIAHERAKGRWHSYKRRHDPKTRQQLLAYKRNWRNDPTRIDEIRQKSRERRNWNYNAAGNVSTRIKYYKISVTNRGLSWTLTDGDACFLFIMECYYCGQLATEEQLNGIDRVDNAKGYEWMNCVSCCKQCNQMKHAYSKSAFINKCIQIASRHSGQIITDNLI